VALKILGTADGIVERMTAAIARELPGSEVAVQAAGSGHFEVRVVAAAFAGKSRVQQHQMVYRAIAPLMDGDAPPVHAIDRLETLTP
jgi:stress-induced morphogen